MYARQQHITRKSESQQPQAITLANPFRIPLHRKRKVKKKIRGQRLRVHPFNPWAFFWPEPCGRRPTGELWHDLPYSSTSKIKKKFFFVFYPHTLTFRLKRPVYRGFSGEGKCFYPHCPHTSGGKNLPAVLNDGIRKISGQLNIIYKQMFFWTLIANLICLIVNSFFSYCWFANDHLCRNLCVE